MVDGTLPAAHALAQALPGDGFIRGLDAPHGKRAAGIHAAVDGEPHHLHVTPVKIPSSQSLQTHAGVTGQILLISIFSYRKKLIETCVQAATQRLPSNTQT